MYSLFFSFFFQMRGPTHATELLLFCEVNLWIFHSNHTIISLLADWPTLTCYLRGPRSWQAGGVLSVYMTAPCGTILCCSGSSIPFKHKPIDSHWLSKSLTLPQPCWHLPELSYCLPIAPYPHLYGNKKLQCRTIWKFSSLKREYVCSYLHSASAHK